MSSRPHFRINSPAVVYEIIDNEVIIIEFDSGNYYSLQYTGTDVWRLIERGAGPADIVAQLSGLYNGPPAVIAEAVDRLLGELWEENLIAPDEAPASPAAQSSDTPFESPPPADRPAFEPPALQKYTDMQELLILDPIHEVDEAGWPTLPADSAAPGR